ncbi:hypothetical protein MTR67_019436, partial [Solanum verrucosum]
GTATSGGGTAHYAAGEYESQGSQWNKNSAPEASSYAGSFNPASRGLGMSSTSHFGDSSQWMNFSHHPSGPFTNAPHFTPEQYNQILHLLDQGNDTNSKALSAAGSLQWKGERDW